MKILNQIKIPALLLPLLLLYSCEDAFWGCIQGNGNIVNQERTIGEFDNIVSSGSFVVEVYPGYESSLSIKTDDNLLDYIRTSIQGNTLVLETRSGRCIRSRESITIYVYTPSVEKLKLSGSGLITCDNISTENLDLELTGSGKINCDNVEINFLRASVPGSGTIEIKGTAHSCDYTISGSGVIKGIDLMTDICYASIPGSGVIYTYVTENLDVNISGSGFLYYKGNPEIEQSITGSGGIRIYR